MKIMLIQTLRYLRKSPFELLETDALLNWCSQMRKIQTVAGVQEYIVQIVIVDGILLEAGQA